MCSDEAAGRWFQLHHQQKAAGSVLCACSGQELQTSETHTERLWTWNWDLGLFTVRGKS